MPRTIIPPGICGCFPILDRLISLPQIDMAPKGEDPKRIIRVITFSSLQVITKQICRAAMHQR